MLLVVDDDPCFLENAESVLGKTGQVWLATTAEQALSITASVGRDLSVALVDLDLPGSDGFTLIRDLHAVSPNLPVIAMSGVVKEYLLESAKLVGACESLRKPITPAWADAIARARSLQ